MHSVALSFECHGKERQHRPFINVCRQKKKEHNDAGAFLRNTLCKADIISFQYQSDQSTNDM